MSIEMADVESDRERRLCRRVLGVVRRNTSDAHRRAHARLTRTLPHNDFIVLYILVSRAMLCPVYYE